VPIIASTVDRIRSHVDRWERADLTYREVATVAHHPNPRLNLTLGGTTHTHIHTRSLTNHASLTLARLVIGGIVRFFMGCR